MAFPHHPAASWKLVSAATDWAFHDEEVQRMVEIFSRHHHLSTMEIIPNIQKIICRSNDAVYRMLWKKDTI